MPRYDFLRKLEIIQSPVDSVQIQTYDILNVNWQSFKFTSGYKIHTITKIEAQKPWLICTNENIDFLYEDVIFLINNIADVTEDLIPGKTLKIPVLKDLVKFTNSIVQ